MGGDVGAGAGKIEFGAASPFAPLSASAFGVLPAGPRVYVSGQAEKGDGTLADATTKTLASLVASLKFCGLERGNIVQLKAFTSPIGSAAIVEKAVAQFFEGAPVPPLILVEWKGGGVPIEIELIASSPSTPKDAPRVEYLTPPELKKSPVYARIVRVNAARMLYVGGLVAGKEGQGGADETNALFPLLKETLIAGGSDLEQMVKATYYVADAEVSAALNKVRPQYYNPDRPPAASKAEVAGTALTGNRITIDMIAAEKEGIAIDSTKRAEELRNLKFGMFIPWSLSTFSGKDETIGCKDLSLFNPTGCDIDQWVSVGKEAGMGYFVFCAKACDGFCLWDTKTTDRKVTKSPWGKDVMAEASRACAKHGVKFAITYEEGDWTWPGAIEGGADWPGATKGQRYPSGLISGIPQAGGNNPEVKKAQLRELLTEYGPVEFIWFDSALGDGGLDHKATAEFVKSIQPGCLVGFNHGQPAGEVRLGEGGRPSALNDPAGAGVNKKQKGMQDYKGYLVGEFVMPIQTGKKGPARWFYSGPQDADKVMPSKDIFDLYQGAAKFGNIFSLGVAPDRAGRLRDIDVKTLREVGKMIRAASTDGSAK